MDITEEIDQELPPKILNVDMHVKDEDEIKEELKKYNIVYETTDQGSVKDEIYHQNEEQRSDILHENGQIKDIQKRRKISRLEIDINLMDIDGEFDAFTDNNSIYRKYKLRDKRKPVKQQIEVPANVTLNRKTKSKSINIPKEEIKDDYACPHCYIDCKSKVGLVGHIKTHKRTTTFACSQCSAKFNSNIKLISHKIDHLEEKSSYTCKKCKLVFGNHCDYLLHETTHINRDKYHCKECEMVCNTKKGFQIHIKTHFDRKIKCEHCFKMIQEYTYQKHLKEHSSSYLVCVECGKLCKDKKHLYYHMSSHTGVKLLQCLYCGKGFANNASRRVHTRIHTGERPYECTTCYEKFVQYTDWKRHMVTHDTVPKHKCDTCGKKFFHKYYIAIHMRQHTNKLDYVCEECGKRFSTSGGLKMHILYKHTTEKNFKCTPCKVSFYDKCQYKRHCCSKRHKNIMYGETLKAKSKQKC